MSENTADSKQQREAPAVTEVRFPTVGDIEEFLRHRSGQGPDPQALMQLSKRILWKSSAQN